MVIGQRLKTRTAITKVIDTWQTAPAHVRVMVASYVEPLIVALLEMEAEILELRGAVDDVLFDEVVYGEA